MHITQITPHIGAMIEDVDLTQPLSKAQFATIHDALLQHAVIFFRDQDITPAQHIAFANLFGDVEPPHPLFPNEPTEPRVAILENDADRPPGRSWWHTDVTWKQHPPLASILHAKAVPSYGGDTMWASMYAVHDALAPEMQAMLGQLTAVHSLASFLGGNFDDDGGRVREIMKKYPPVEHPVIRTHPITKRKAVFINHQFTSHIKGLSHIESDAILNMLHQMTLRPEFQVRLHWEKNTIAMWDNRCTQHYAVVDYYPQYRKMQRVTIIGDRPYFTP